MSINTLHTSGNLSQAFYMHKRRLNYEAEGRKLKEATPDSKTHLMTPI
jgi:hypothetical protein